MSLVDLMISFLWWFYISFTYCGLYNLIFMMAFTFHMSVVDCIRCWSPHGTASTPRCSRGTLPQTRQSRARARKSCLGCWTLSSASLRAPGSTSVNTSLVSCILCLWTVSRFLVSCGTLLTYMLLGEKFDVMWHVDIAWWTVNFCSQCYVKFYLLYAWWQLLQYVGALLVMIKSNE